MCCGGLVRNGAALQVAVAVLRAVGELEEQLLEVGLVGAELVDRQTGPQGDVADPGQVVPGRGEAVGVLRPSRPGRRR